MLKCSPLKLFVARQNKLCVNAPLMWALKDLPWAADVWISPNRLNAAGKEKFLFFFFRALIYSPIKIVPFPQKPTTAPGRGAYIHDSLE